MILCPFFNLKFFNMANFKLGAIFTDVAGSISGTTFRRTPRGIIAYNKQGTQIKSAFAAASVKNRLGVIFASWNLLDNETKTFWANKAALYPQLNKFGDLVYLTGRQFYTKLNTQLIPAGISSDPANFSDVLPSEVGTECIINLGEETALINFSEAVTVYLGLVRVQQTRSANGSVKPHAHFRNTKTEKLEGALKIVFYNEFMEQFPFAQVGDNFIVHLIFMNASGFQTSIQGFAVTIT
jgi:hypothetical protein